MNNKNIIKRIQDGNLVQGTKGSGLKFYTTEYNIGAIPLPYKTKKHARELKKSFTKNEKYTREEKSKLNLTDGSHRAMTQGWIIRNPSSFKLRINEDGEYTLTETQRGNNIINSEDKKDHIIISFNTEWWIETPENVSILATNILGLNDKHFKVIPQIIDTDIKPIRLDINFKMDKKTRVFDGEIPLAQVIPINRENTQVDATLKKL